MKEQKELSPGIDFEAEIMDRINALIEMKKVENDFAFGRLDKMETSWQDVNNALDKELTAEMHQLDTGTTVIKKAKELLHLNIPLRTIQNKYGISGMVVEKVSKAGLPGLCVKIALGEPDKNEYFAEDITDSNGNFSMQLSVDLFNLNKLREVDIRFDVFLSTDKIVHSEVRHLSLLSMEKNQIILEVEPSEELKESMDFAEQVKEGVKIDTELVTARILNMKSAYTAYARMIGITLSSITELKAAAAAGPPKINPLAIEIETETEQLKRYLGNSDTREFHDMLNKKPGCRIEEIRSDHRVHFLTEKEATDMGYDYCACCFGKAKSRR